MWGSRYTSPTPRNIASTGGVTVYVSPDYSFQTLTDHIASATKTFALYMYAP